MRTALKLAIAVAATLALAQRAYIINNGHVVHEGPTGEIKANPDVLMHASYITDAILFTKTFKEMGFKPKGAESDDHQPSSVSIPYRRVNGQWPYLPEGIEENADCGRERDHAERLHPAGPSEREHGQAEQKPSAALGGRHSPPLPRR